MHAFTGGSPAQFATSAAASIKKYNDELKRLGAEMKSLRQKKTIEEQRLYKYMCEAKVEEFGGITKKSLQPKPKVKADEKRAAGIQFLETQGIDNPSRVYELLKQTQTRQYILGGVNSTQEMPKMVYYES